MADKTPDLQYDPYIIEKLFPSPTEVMTTVHPPLKDVIGDCLFVLDANTLLAPFLVGKDSLKDVAQVLTKLAKADRLFIPAHAVREYARHRASKIAEAFGNVQQRLSEIPPTPKAMEISMFEEVPQYREVIESSDKLRAAIKDYKAKLQSLQEEIRFWNWNDPVSKLYATLITESQIINHGKAEEEISADLARRVLHQIPPGYKDKSKPDGGIGDLIIWHTILKLGEEKGANVAFITNDGKADWMVRHGDEPLYPRFELVEEFRRLKSKNFIVLRFTRFLNLMGANENTVEEVAAVTRSGTAWGELELSANSPTASSLSYLMERLRDAGNPFTPFKVDDAFVLATEKFIESSQTLGVEMGSVPTSSGTLDNYSRLREEVLNSLKLILTAWRDSRAAGSSTEQNEAMRRLQDEARRTLKPAGELRFLLREIA